METMAVSKFKATCLSVLQRVGRSGKPVLITRFGRPVAEIVPPRRRRAPGAWIGCMEGRGRAVGDIVAPAARARDWDALRR